MLSAFLNHCPCESVNHIFTEYRDGSFFVKGNSDAPDGASELRAVSQRSEDAKHAGWLASGSRVGERGLLMWLI